MFSSFKFYHAILAIISIIFVLLFISLTIIKKQSEYGYERIIIDMKDTEFNAYSSGNRYKGSTTKTIDAPNEKGFDCTIRHVEQYPFCVLTIEISSTSNKGMDFSSFKEMTVYGTFTTPNSDFLRIGFRHFDPNYSQSNITNTMKFNQLELKSDNLAQSFNVNFDVLTVPAWWVAALKSKDVNDTIELTNVALIELSTGTLPSEGEYKLRVDRFELEKEIISLNQVYEYLMMFWATLLVLLMIIIMAVLAFRLNQKSKNEKILLQINHALENKSNELELISQTDALTGTFNRIGLQKRLIEIIKQKQFPTAITLIDIDHFKSINDEFGHQQGDHVLKELCNIIKSHLIEGESLSRFGGEEFLILMPGLSIDQVKERINDIRLDIESTDMKINRCVTASFGVAQINKNNNVKQIIAQSDEALYQAKNEGRNCIRYNE